MAWVVETPGTSASLVSASLGNLLTSKVRVVVEHATWSSSSYLFSQASVSSGTREFGFFIQGGVYRVIVGGTANNTGVTTAAFPIVDGTIDVTVDFVAGTLILICDGTTMFDGAIAVGPNRVDGMEFRMFARQGGYRAATGTRVGHTTVFIDDILVRDYDFDGSFHGAALVDVDELVDPLNELLAVNMALDGTPWIDIGGVAIDYSADLTTPNIAYSPNPLSWFTDYTAALVGANLNLVAAPIIAQSNYGVDLTLPDISFSPQQLNVETAIGYQASLTSVDLNLTAQALIVEADFTGTLSTPDISLTVNPLSFNDNYTAELSSPVISFNAIPLVQEQDSGYTATLTTGQLNISPQDFIMAGLYRLELDTSNGTYGAGGLVIALGGNDVATVTADGTHVFNVLAGAGNDIEFKCVNSNDFIGDVDSVKLVQI